MLEELNSPKNNNYVRKLAGLFFCHVMKKRTNLKTLIHSNKKSLGKREGLYTTFIFLSVISNKFKLAHSNTNTCDRLVMDREESGVYSNLKLGSIEEILELFSKPKLSNGIPIYEIRKHHLKKWHC